MKKIYFDKYINYLIVGYAFTLPTTISGIVFFSHLIILSFFIKAIISHKDFMFSDLKKSTVILVITTFIILSFISIIWSSDKIFALVYLKKYYHFLVIPIIYLSLNPKYLKHIFTGFLLGMLLSEILSYGIFFEIIHFDNVRPNNPSPFMNHSDYSLYLSLSSMILLNRIFFTNKNTYKIFYFLYFLTTVSNLFLNGGRTGQFIFIASLFIVLMLNIKHKLMAGTIAATLAIAIISIAYNTSPVFKERGAAAYHDITSTLFDKNYSQSFGIRVSLWIMGLNVFKDNILLGTGIGDEKTGMQKYAKKYNISRYQNLQDSGYIDYHSMYVQHAVQLGIIGLILIFYLVYSIFMLKFRSPLYRNINIAFATSVLIYSLVGNIIGTIFPLSFFVFFAAILTATSRIETSN